MKKNWSRCICLMLMMCLMAGCGGEGDSSGITEYLYNGIKRGSPIAGGGVV